jgi:catechol 2,3-dioxygenase-like lactoylglutathione lyase family enzyme
MLELAVPVIRVSDSKTAEAFYCGGLGFRVAAAWRPDGAKSDPCYMTLVRDGAQLHVHSFQSGASGESAVYVFVDDIDALYAELVAKGLAVQAPIDQSWGTREIGLRDADRNIVTFGQRRPTQT